jgi:phosphotransferase system IIA component
MADWNDDLVYRAALAQQVHDRAVEDAKRVVQGRALINAGTKILEAGGYAIDATKVMMNMADIELHEDRVVQAAEAIMYPVRTFQRSE